MNELNLVGKIAKISGLMGAIDKSRKKDSKLEYGYQGIDDVINALNPLMAEEGVISTVTVLECVITDVAVETKYGSKAGVRAFVGVRVVVTDGITKESTDEYALKIDYSDKSVTQAISMATKYALLRLFKVKTKDIIDPDEFGQHTPQQTPTAKPTPQSEPPAAQLLQAFMVGVRKLVTDAEFNGASQKEKNAAFVTWKQAENKEEAIHNAITELAKHYKWQVKNA